MADVPSRGLADVVAASTAISDIDGRAGRLFYRGYDIHDLAGKISFEECVHLLTRGTLPTQAQLDSITAELGAGRALGPTVLAVLPLVAAKASPMEALRTEFRANGWKTAVLVTDPWHELRARRMASDLGIKAATSPTRTSHRMVR